MRYIVISGNDGSGKTTLINHLEQYFKDQGKNTLTIWLRYNHYMVRPVHGLSRVIGLSKKYQSSLGTAWRHEFYKSPLFCWFYIQLTYIDTLIGKVKLFCKIVRSKKNFDYIICDRWVNDILIDLGTKTHNPVFLDTSQFERFQRLMPDNNIQFLVIRENEKVLDCRPESREDPDFELRTLLYEKLKSKENIHIVNNNGTIEESMNSILNIL